MLEGMEAFLGTQSYTTKRGYGSFALLPCLDDTVLLTVSGSDYSALAACVLDTVSPPGEHNHTRDCALGAYEIEGSA
jgi:hypothetical protein